MNGRDRALTTAFRQMRILQSYRIGRLELFCFIPKEGRFVNTTQLCGAVSVMLLVVAVGFLSGRKVKGASDFISGGGTAGSGTVAGMVMGTLVGAACTIGTAQLAYSYGISAWWYTLGCCIACMLIGLLYAKPWRHSKFDTMAEILLEEYGRNINIATSLLSVLSLVLTLAAQLVAASTIVPCIFPGLGNAGCLLLTVALMLVYVVFGGTLGAGEIGKIKVALLYAAIIAGVVIIVRSVTISSFRSELDSAIYFDLFLFGAGEEVGKVLSAVLGLVSTQCYMQAMRMARSDRAARNGAVISAVLIPPIGAGSVLIGLFMRMQHPNLANSKDTFSQFILEYMPNWLSGIFMGALVLVVIGAGASVALAAATVLIQGVVRPLFPRFHNEQVYLFLIRLSIIAILAISSILGSGVLGDVVLNFTFLASRILASTLFAPLICALFFPGKIHRTWACLSATIAPAAVLVFTAWQVLPFDSMFAGILVGTLCCAIGAAQKHKKARLAVQ